MHLFKIKHLNLVKTYLNMLWKANRILFSTRILEIFYKIYFKIYQIAYLFFNDTSCKVLTYLPLFADVILLFTPQHTILIFDTDTCKDTLIWSWTGAIFGALALMNPKLLLFTFLELSTTNVLQ